MNQYNIEILELTCDQSNLQFPDLVVAVHFKVTALNEDLSRKAEYFGNAILSEPENNFVPFAELTESTVISWVENAVDIQAIKQELDIRLTNPPPEFIQKPLPWATA